LKNKLCYQILAFMLIKFLLTHSDELLHMFSIFLVISTEIRRGVLTLHSAVTG